MNEKGKFFNETPLTMELLHEETGDTLGKEYWITPPKIYEALDQEFHFDFDPCPYPHKPGFDGTLVEWGKSSYCNPTFRSRDAKFGKGPTAFVRKAIEENRKGKTVVIMLNTNAFINILVEAGAEMRSMGRLKWLSGKTGEPWPSPSNTTCFILRPKQFSDTDRLNWLESNCFTNREGERECHFDFKGTLREAIDSRLRLSPKCDQSPSASEFQEPKMIAPTKGETERDTL